MIEEWKDIKGYEGLYKVSNTGKVMSVERYRKNHTKLQLVPAAIKSSRTDPQGYHQIDLYKDNIQHTVRVHRLVAETFIDNPLGKDTVNHIDGNKDNNRADNLEWATSEEQNRHLYKHNLKKKENIQKAVSAMNAASSKKVRCVETNEIFKSCSEARVKFSPSRRDGSIISRACRTGCIAYGYHWMYV